MTSSTRRNTVYLCPTEHCPQLMQLAIGILPMLGDQVGIFRPIVAEPDDDALLDNLICQINSVSGVKHWGVSAQELQDNSAAALAQVISRYHELTQHYSGVLVLGSEYDCSLAPVEFTWNTKVAANIDAPMILIVPSSGGAREIRRRIRVAIDEALNNFAQVISVIVPRDAEQSLAGSDFAEFEIPVFVVEQVTGNDAGCQGTLTALDAKPLAGGDSCLTTRLGKLVVADMNLENLLPLLSSDSVVLFSGDRAEIGLGMVIAGASGQFPMPAAAIAAGSWRVDPKIVQLWKALAGNTPLLATSASVPEAYLKLRNFAGASSQLTSVQIEQARRLFERDVDANKLLAGDTALGKDEVVTPLMFEHRLLERARKLDRHIVLPEGYEERIIRAAHRLLEQGICRLTLLGDPDKIKQTAANLQLDISKAEIINPATSELVEKFAEKYAELRAKKGVTIEQARQKVVDESYFGTMMVYFGLADGMVSGAVNTTAATIRPALEVIKTKPGFSVVSGAFLMCLADRVLVFADCAVNPNPKPEQVADIAISSAQTARAFGIEPRVALLSYSTGSSGAGPDVEQTKEATKIAKERAPELALEGPLQFDAAVDPTVARTKMPDSPVAGKATVFIFPDLKTGNNTYKAVQRSAGALAVGPLLQGLNKPVNDLSRGALVSDIVNTVAMTAIQAAMD